MKIKLIIKFIILSFVLVVLRKLFGFENLIIVMLFVLIFFVEVKNEN